MVPRPYRARGALEASGALSASRARLSFSTLTRGTPKMPRSGPVMWLWTSWVTWSGVRPRAWATRGTCAMAASGEISGSRPEPEVVSRSAGSVCRLGFSARRLAASLADPVDQLLIGRSEVRAARAGRVVAVGAGGRGPRMKVFVLVERLGDQLGADRLAVALDDAAARLIGKDRTSDPGDQRRIETAADEQQHDGEADGSIQKPSMGETPGLRIRARRRWGRRSGRSA